MTPAPPSVSSAAHAPEQRGLAEPARPDRHVTRQTGQPDDEVVDELVAAAHLFGLKSGLDGETATARRPPVEN